MRTHEDSAIRGAARSILTIADGDCAGAGEWMMVSIGGAAGTGGDRADIRCAGSRRQRWHLHGGAPLCGCGE